MNAGLLRSVWTRAERRCEYCHMPSSRYFGSFHVDHIIARQHGGETDMENLALSCMNCNRRKGPNIAGIDPISGKVVRLYHPRQDRWSDHFEWNGPVLVGKTKIGQATINVVGVNEERLQAMRMELRNSGVTDWD
jgi:hypothetical protein